MFGTWHLGDQSEFLRRMVCYSNGDSDQKNNVESLAVKTTLALGEEKDISVFVRWHFPNRGDWNYKENVDNFYTTQCEDS